MCKILRKIECEIEVLMCTRKWAVKIAEGEIDDYNNVCRDIFLFGVI